MTGERHLLLFTFTRMTDVLDKGNVWYVRHYERYFDKVTVVYLIGHEPKEIRQGNTTLLSLTPMREAKLKTLLLMPWRLLRLSRRIMPTSFLTADPFFSWWTGLLLRLLDGAPIVLMPVSNPPVLYAATGRSITGYPMWLERRLTRLSFRVAKKVIVLRDAVTQSQWLSGEPSAARKLQVVSAQVEQYPTPAFFDTAKARHLQAKPLGKPPSLLYVGRLHREKLTGDLIDMMAALRDRNVAARLVVAGDGPDRDELERRSRELGVAGDIEWLGHVANENLPELYARADVFVSTVTGTALREAGLMGIPIVGYRLDWVQDLLRDGETALLVPLNRPDLLAEKVAMVLTDDTLRKGIASAFYKVASARWRLENIRVGLAEVFDDDIPARQTDRDLPNRPDIHSAI